MKKIIIAAAFAACALGMNAQLTVLKSGNVRIGYKSLVPQPWKPANATSATIPGNTDLLALPDSLSTLCLIGKDTNGSGSYITFGFQLMKEEN